MNDTVFSDTLYNAYGVSSQGAQNSVRINWLNRHVPNPQDQREYAQERCVVAATEAINDAMEAAGLNQADVAKKLGKSPAYVSRVLNGAHNMTLYTLGDMLWACDVEMRAFDAMPLGEIQVSVDDAITFYAMQPTTGPSPPDAGGRHLDVLLHTSLVATNSIQS